jgi:predicted RNA binding protein YcfA (HicA-like mRNA interferase family)
MPLAYKITKDILLHYKFELDHQTGSHQIWKKWTAQVVVPKKKEFAIWTARNIIKRIAQLSQTSLQTIAQDYQIKF